ncbi:MAG: anti-sigma factor [Pseudomonadota bacterium]
MNCAAALPLISAFADGELDVLRGHSVRKHVAGCAACAAEYENIRLLSTRLRDEAPRFVASPALQSRVRAALHRAETEQPVGKPRRVAGTRSWFFGGAFAGCAATVLAWFMVTALLQWHASEDLVAEAVAMHVRATLGNHLIEIVSTDRHTVKPWLSARLDYSPPVQDLAEAGFALAGGRLDYLDGRPVAVLVYRYRLHMIDVFVRPETGHATPAALRTLRGFNVVHASGSGMEWLAVSDAGSDVLSPFLQQLAQGSASTASEAR